MSKDNNVQEAKKLAAQAKELGLDTKGLSFEDLKSTVENALKTQEVKTDTTEGASNDSKVQKTSKADQEIKADSTESVEAIVDHWTDAGGQKWGFKKNAYKTYNWDGEQKTQEEILKDDLIMEALTKGNYSFIKQLD